MNLRATFFASVAGLAAALPAQAEQLPMTPQTGVTIGDFFYMSVGGTYQRINLPAFAWVYTAANQPVNRSLHVDAGGPAVTVGYVLDGMPAYLGERVRIEFSGQFLWGIGRANVASTGPGNAFQEINGVGTVVNTDTRNSVTTQLESGDGVFRLKSDFRLGSMVTVSPSAGVIAGFSRVKYDALNAWQPAVFEDTMVAKIQNARVGGELGADATLRMNDALQFHAGVTAAAFWQSARLTADQCIDSAALVTGCQAGPPPAGLSHRLTNNETSWGYRVGTSLGVTYNWGWAQLTLMGNGAFNAKTPGIELQTPGTNKPARISYDDRWSYGGYLMVAFPLN